KSRPITKIMASLSIPGLGNTMAKLLVKRFKDIDGVLGATVEEIAELDKMGMIRATQVVEGLKHRAALIATLREGGVACATGEVAEGAPLAGMSFAISGAVPAPFPNRGAWQDYVEANGGEFHSGPKATTTYMVGDSGESSSKIKKARDLGLEFLTAAEFTEKF